jgi:UPF0755 protein
VRRAARALLLLALCGAVAVVAVGAWCWHQLGEPWAGWAGAEVIVDLPRGLAAGAMLDTLADAGVLRRPALARAWLVLSGRAGTLQAGEYRFDAPGSAFQVLERLAEGDVLLHAVTLPEGLVLDEIAARFAAAGVAEHDALLAAMQGNGPVRDLAPEVPDLEGFLYPDTYHFPRGESPERIVETMVARLRVELGKGYAERAKAVGLSVAEAVTLASLIELETSVPEERSRISRVFHNRLERGMRLQCDPTVIYAWHRRGEPVERLLSGHLEVDSPWNTYKVRGLPPGPIGAPGRQSLEAAVQPGEGDDLYFVAAPGGGHRFSRDLASHQRAVREWRRYLRSSR